MYFNSNALVLGILVTIILNFGYHFWRQLHSHKQRNILLKTAQISIVTKSNDSKNKRAA